MDEELIILPRIFGKCQPACTWNGITLYVQCPHNTVNPVMLAPKIISVFDRTHVLAAYKFSEILTASYNT